MQIEEVEREVVRGDDLERGILILGMWWKCMNRILCDGVYLLLIAFFCFSIFKIGMKIDMCQLEIFLAFFITSRIPE